MLRHQVRLQPLPHLLNRAAEQAVADGLRAAVAVLLLGASTATCQMTSKWLQRQ